jgi:prepilin-type N-terminal cleavage/methylation domain-containing protein
MRGSSGGFTLVEIVVVTLIIGVLASIAIPLFMHARRDTQNTCFINDLRQLVAAFEFYSLEHRGQFPADRYPGETPPELIPYMPKGFRWSEPAPIGGQWDWDLNPSFFPCKAALSVYLPGRSDAEMTVIDGLIDDNNLNSGAFRKAENRFMYIVEM